MYWSFLYFLSTLFTSLSISLLKVWLKFGTDVFFMSFARGGLPCSEVFVDLNPLLSLNLKSTPSLMTVCLGCGYFFQSVIDDINAWCLGSVGPEQELDLFILDILGFASDLKFSSNFASKKSSMSLLVPDGLCFPADWYLVLILNGFADLVGLLSFVSLIGIKCFFVFSSSSDLVDPPPCCSVTRFFYGDSLKFD